MGERIAKWFFRTRLSYFELFTILATITFFPGFWPAFVVPVAASVFAMRMQNALRLDN